MGNHDNASNKANGDLFENCSSLFSDLELPTLSKSMNATPWFDENASIFAHEDQMGHSSLVNDVGNLSGSPLFTSSNGCNLSISMGKNQGISTVSNPSKSPCFGMNCSFSTTTTTTSQFLNSSKPVTLLGSNVGSLAVNSSNSYKLPMRSHSSLLSNFNKIPLLLGSTSARKNQSQTHFPPPIFASNPNFFGSKRSLSIANHSNTTTVPYLGSMSSSFIHNPHRNQLGFAPNLSIFTSSIENPVSKYQMSMNTFPYSTPSYINFETLYQCTSCPKVFPSKHALGGHMSSHSRTRKRETLIDDFLNNKLENNSIIRYRRGLALTLSDGDNPDFSIEVYSSELPNKKMKYLEEREEMTTDHGVVMEEFCLLPDEIGMENLLEHQI